ncbi:MAG: undecaprenyl-diphosphate phosphatase [Proteobacteria bacterium]|nr:undecaprenyl-diphosphate phosphatase [Pseudomonadota bacterium]
MFYSLLVFCIVQSITEFLPVSSTAHLIIIQQWFNSAQNSLLLEVGLHLGTLLAIVLFYIKDVSNLIFSFIRGTLTVNNRDTPYFKLSLYIIAATIPSILAGFLIKPYIEFIHNNLWIIAFSSILFGGLLAFVDLSNPQDQDEITFSRALLIGLGQLFAFIPGGSRLGTTVTVSRILGLSRLKAFHFSMLISIPVVLGAVVLTSIDALKNGCFDLSFEFGFILAVTFCLSYLTLFLVNKFIDRVGFFPFGIYRILFGIFLILYLLSY